MPIVLIATALYLAAAGWLVASVQREDAAPRGWLLPANLALLLHGATHYLAWRASGSTDLHFFAALSLAGLGMAILTAIVGASGRMRALGVVVFPLAALALLGYGLYGHASKPEPLDWRLLLHAWLALLAYATLAIAIGLPWAVSLGLMAILGFGAGLFLNMGGRWMATVVVMIALALIVQAMIWLFGAVM